MFYSCASCLDALQSWPALAILVTAIVPAYLAMKLSNPPKGQDSDKYMTLIDITNNRVYCAGVTQAGEQCRNWSALANLEASSTYYLCAHHSKQKVEGKLAKRY